MKKFLAFGCFLIFMICLASCGQEEVDVNYPEWADFGMQEDDVKEKLKGRFEEGPPTDAYVPNDISVRLKDYKGNDHFGFFEFLNEKLVGWGQTFFLDDDPQKDYEAIKLKITDIYGRPTEQQGNDYWYNKDEEYFVLLELEKSEDNKNLLRITFQTFSDLIIVV